MNTFYRRSINEYQRQIGLKESFAIQTERVRGLLESFDAATAGGENRPTASSLLLFPLVETAWADGRVSRREADAILETARAYGTLENDADYRALIENLTTRPIPQTVGRVWQDFRYWFESLSEFERETIAFCLDVQARYVAEQSSDNLLAFLQGVRVSRNETETLRAIERQLKGALKSAKLSEENSLRALSEQRLKRAEIAAPSRSETAAPAAEIVDYFDDRTLEDYGKLVPLVPLVKTAWAEGRITKRERHLIFEAARRMDILPGTPAHEKLEQWLELHPTQEFYDAALDTLSEHWRAHADADEASRKRFDLLSDCTRVAEASGGSKDFRSGGARICDEEIAAVKYIARKLHPNAAQATATLN